MNKLISLLAVSGFAAVALFAAPPTYATDPVPGVDISLTQNPGALRQSRDVPVRIDAPLEGKNYQSTRSNVTRKPGLAISAEGLLPPDGFSFFHAPTAMMEGDGGERAAVPFVLPEECGAECHFNIRLTGLEDAIVNLVEDLGSTTIPGGTQMVVATTIGREVFEIEIPIQDVFADDDYTEVNRFFLRRFVGQAGTAGEVEIFFAIPDDTVRETTRGE